jgi:type 1 glutamine amidotransferase
MTRFQFIRAAIASLALTALSLNAADAKTKVLLITGGHGFEREPFLKVFRENPNITLTHAEHTKGTADAYDRADLFRYDAVVLYDMPKEIKDTQKQRFIELTKKGIGLVVLHHALVSYQHWRDYERIIGGRYPEEDGKGGVVTEKVGYQHDVDYTVKIAAKDHPITVGLSDFPIKDEIYWGFRTGSDIKPLITTDQPKSGKPLGWTRTEANSRIVYLQLGHGPEAYSNPNYRKLIAQSIAFVTPEKQKKP